MKISPNEKTDSNCRLGQQCDNTICMYVTWPTMANNNI